MKDAVHLEEDGVFFGRRRSGGRGCLLESEPVAGLLGRFQELLVADRLEKEVQGAYLVAVKGILLEGGGEDDAGIGREHAGKLHPVQVRHLDVQEHQFGNLGADLRKGQDRVVEGSGQLQERSTLHETLQHLYGQRLVVDHYATQCLHTVKVTITV